MKMSISTSPTLMGFVTVHKNQGCTELLNAPVVDISNHSPRKAEISCSAHPKLPFENHLMERLTQKGSRGGGAPKKAKKLENISLRINR